jgi:hypothetical protein
MICCVHASTVEAAKLKAFCKWLQERISIASFERRLPTLLHWCGKVCEVDPGDGPWKHPVVKS